MLIYLKPAMLNSIQSHLYKAKASGHLIDIHETAEEIRLEHISDNIAREDIIEKLVFFARTMGIKFDPNSVASEHFSSFQNAASQQMA